MNIKNAGFTLIELMMVTMVISLLAAIAIPLFNGQKQKAFDAKTQSNLVNAYDQMRTLWIQSEEYNFEQIAVADKNEPGLEIKPRSSEPYLQNSIQASFPSQDTVVLTQKSKSGRNFCVAGYEKQKGRKLSWENTEILDAECSTALAMSPTAAIPQTPNSNQESAFEVPKAPPTEGSTTSTNPGYGDYEQIKSRLGENATCHFDEYGERFVPINCGGATGQIQDGPHQFQFGQEGALMTLDQQGKRIAKTGNRAIYFTGVQQWSYANNNNKILTAGAGGANLPWSAEVWAKPDRISGTQGIIGMNQGFAFNMTSQGFRAVVQQGNQYWGTRTIEVPYALSTQKWYHLFMTYDQGTLRFYIDGKIAGELKDIKPLHAGRGNLDFAYNTWTDNYQYVGYRGYIDEFSFYNKQLTSQEVKSLYEAGAQQAVQ